MCILRYKIECCSQITNFNEYDIKYLSGDESNLIFEYGGDLYTYDLNSKQQTKVLIEIHSELATAQSKWVKADDILTNASLSPSGQRTFRSKVRSLRYRLKRRCEKYYKFLRCP